MWSSYCCWSQPAQPGNLLIRYANGCPSCRWSQQVPINMHMLIYTYMYVCVCVCLCVCNEFRTIL